MLMRAMIGRRLLHSLPDVRINISDRADLDQRLMKLLCQCLSIGRAQDIDVKTHSGQQGGRKQRGPRGQLPPLAVIMGPRPGLGRTLQDHLFLSGQDRNGARRVSIARDMDIHMSIRLLHRVTGMQASQLACIPVTRCSRRMDMCISMSLAMDTLRAPFRSWPDRNKWSCNVRPRPGRGP